MNRLLALAFNVPALLYVSVKFPHEFRGYARNVGRTLLTGKADYES